MKRFFIAVLCALMLVSSIAFCETDGLIEEAVSIGDPALPGTLTLPGNFSSPLPAAVLLHGSGPNDRDETLGQTKMFRDLADGLAEKGVAVLRYDKRTLIYGSRYTQEDLKTFTVAEESIQDAVAAAQILRADPRISQVYLIGHSMGAMIAPRIAKEYPGLFDGIILLSGTPKTLGDIVLSQNQAIVDALPQLTKAIGQIQMQGLRKEWENLLNSSEEEAKKLTVFGQPGYYFWEMARHDAGEILQALDIPALLINGGRDFQVIDADGIDAWNALRLPENVQVIYHPELNHLLMNPDAPEEARNTVAEYDTPCHISQEIIAEIAEFILK
jgi:pimeloyl-ACP methyl ester carboxylesterase